MTEVEQRLTELLDRRAEACRPQERLDEILGIDATSEATHELIDIRPTLHERRRRRLLGAAAAAVLVIGGAAIAAVVATQRTDERAAGSIAPTPTVVVPAPHLGVPRPLVDASGVFAAADHTDRVVVAEGEHIAGSSVHVSQIVPYADGYVAVGTTRVGFRTEPAVWRSDDALTWRRVADPSLQTAPIESPTISYGWSIDKLTVRDNRLVAVGYAVGDELSDSEAQIAAWVSDDGDHWTRHALPVSPNPRISVTGAVATDDGFTVALFDNSGDQSGSEVRSLILRSTDGAEWAESNAPLLNAAGTHVFGMTAINDNLIAYGSTGGNKGVAALWTSADGATWTASPAALPSGLTSTAFVDAAPTSHGMILVARLLGDGVNALRLWSTADGVTLESIESGPLNVSTDELGEMAISDGPMGALISATRLSLSGAPVTGLWLIDDATLRRVEDVPADFQPVWLLTPVEDGYLAVSGVRAAQPNRPSGSAELWIIPAAAD